MKAYLILVGTELLNGMMIDTNSIYMAEELNKSGIEIVGKSVIGDIKIDIKNTIAYAYNHADLVIMSGGLGPTIDDLTKDAIAEFLDEELIIDKLHYKNMEKKFSERGIPVLEKNKKEVMVIKGSEVFLNEPGIAPAFYFDKIVAFPGVPIELKNMFPKFIEYISKKYKLKNEVFIKDILVWGIPESVLEEKVKEFITDSDEITFEFLVKNYGIIIRMQAFTEKKDLVLEIRNKIKNKLGENAFGEDSDRLENLLMEKLKSNKLSLSTAESCTGGMIASTLVSLSGVSDVYIEGLVTYSNYAKIHRLKVNEQTLVKYGAVSSETVKEMLQGLRTECGIAVSGIAGPNGGTEEKPVGTVYIGVKVNNEINIERYHFNGGREKIRQRATVTALYSLLKFLERGKGIC